MRKFIATLVSLSVLTLGAGALAQTYKIDPSHSYIGFEIEHLGFSTTMGRFHDYDVMVTADWNDVERSNVTVAIRTTSVDTAWAARDEHLRRADFFNVKMYPEMTFTSGKLVKTGENTARMEGELMMLGITKPVVLDVELVKRGAYPFGDKSEALGIKARGVIKRSEWGLNYGVPAVGDDVVIRIDGELRLTE